MILRAMLEVATVRASHAIQVKDDDPDKVGYPGSAGWGLGLGLPHLLKICCANKLLKLEEAKVCEGL